MRRLLVPALVLVLAAAAGCSGRDKDASSSAAPTTSGAADASATDFGTLKNVCGGGTPKTASETGVSSTEIKVGVFSDIGFTKNPEFVNAAKAFTSWCNAAGGIGGRKIVPTTHDSKLYEVNQRMIEACRDDFFLVGGGSALDALGVKTRLKCLLPEFPGQVSQEFGADLQVLTQGASVGYEPYTGYYSWLIDEKYPTSKKSVGLINGDVPVTKVIGAQEKEALEGIGAKVTYTDLYPAQGVSDWTPYAQSIKKAGVKGLIFNGDFTQLAKLEQALTNIGYKPDWIDTNSNAYGDNFIKLAGTSLTSQNNYADLGGTYPLEKEADNPATAQLVALFKKYAPGSQVTFPAVHAFSAWLLFATSASQCAELTRKCVYDNAKKQTAWTGGGLQAPVDLSSSTEPVKCFNVEQATAKGWVPADFKPTDGAYRCDAPAYKFKGNYGKPVTLADVGKSLSDLK
ncbi:hypothetical protein OK074_0352 [Actinobacteria bacterium OK074]|nr:hypothetical protein OK074_0352 [Actinobacteria bacterium OK074]